MDKRVARGRLTAVMQEWLDGFARGEAEPFVWGVNDCVLCPANLHVRAGLHDPILAGFRRRYRSMLGAYRLMGGPNLEKMVERAAKRRKWREHVVGTLVEKDGTKVPAWFGAKPGDIGLMKSVVPFRRRLGRTGPEGMFIAEVTMCVIRGPHGDWHGPIDNGVSCWPDRHVFRAWDVLPE